MGQLIGMDEAGYGPNLGPLVISVTVWESAGSPKDIDLWDSLAQVVSQTRPKAGEERLHVADSKEVYSPQRGIEMLELAVLSGLSLLGQHPRTLEELWELVAFQPDDEPFSEPEPWFADLSLPLPHVADATQVETLSQKLQQTCADSDVQLKAMRSAIVLTERFNRHVAEYDSKGVALSRFSLQLLRSVWNPVEEPPTSVVCDKHGGRNRYDQLIGEVVGDQMVFRLQEGREFSAYRVSKTELQFRTKAESHLPVAWASLLSKYLRELSMVLFNRFWTTHLPGLKPTKGYPTDARRFREDVSEVQQQLHIPDRIFWRER